MRLLYLIWLLLPSALFLCFLWSALEGYRTGKTAERGYLWRSTVHTFFVVTIAIIIHRYGISPLFADSPALWSVKTFIDVGTLPIFLIIAGQDGRTPPSRTVPRRNTDDDNPTLNHSVCFYP